MRTTEDIIDARIDANTVSKSIARRVTSNFLWSVVSEATAKGAVLITNIYLARVLGVTGFGIFSLAQAVTFHAWLAVDLGIEMYGIREIAKDKENAESIINPLLTLRAVAGTFFFALYAVIFVVANMPTSTKLAFICSGLYLLTFSVYSHWIFKGFEKFKFIAFGSFVSSVIYVTAVLFSVQDGDDFARASFIWSLSYLFGSVSLLYFMPRTLGIRFKPSFAFETWFSHVKESIYFTVSGALLTICRYLPILLLGLFFSSGEVGLFSAPYKIVLAVGTAGAMLSTAFYPVFSELYGRGDGFKLRANHANLRKIMLVIGIPVGLVGTCFGDEIINILLGEQYFQSKAVFMMLVWLVPLYFLRYTYGSVLMATGFQRAHNLAMLAGVACAVVSGLALVPSLGVEGGAMALIISEISIIGSMALIYRMKIERHYRRL